MYKSDTASSSSSDSTSSASGTKNNGHSLTLASPNTPASSSNWSEIVVRRGTQMMENSCSI
jgi:hypothetical protein